MAIFLFGDHDDHHVDRDVIMMLLFSFCDRGDLADPTGPFSKGYDLSATIPTSQQMAATARKRK